MKILLGMVVPLFNIYNQWLVVNDTNGVKPQMILFDERGQTLNEINCDTMNVTLVGKDKIAFLTQSGAAVCPRRC